MSLQDLAPENTKRAQSTAISVFKAFLANDNVTMDFVRGVFLTDSNGAAFVKLKAQHCHELLPQRQELVARRLPQEPSCHGAAATQDGSIPGTLLHKATAGINVPSVLDLEHFKATEDNETAPMLDQTPVSDALLHCGNDGIPGRVTSETTTQPYSAIPQKMQGYVNRILKGASERQAKADVSDVVHDGYQQGVHILESQGSEVSAEEEKTVAREMELTNHQNAVIAQLINENKSLFARVAELEKRKSNNETVEISSPDTTSSVSAPVRRRSHHRSRREKVHLSVLLQRGSSGTPKCQVCGRATDEAFRLLPLAARDSLHCGDLPAFLAEAKEPSDAAELEVPTEAIQPSDAAELEVPAEAKEQGVSVAEVVASVSTVFAAAPPAEAKSLNAH
ncbi:hypothetical protein ON010_g3598 [Phytophthora cinnamomi]|nr:hypothetical protein ON010_g3598 [Phytophthora cinnamomi]